MRDYEFPTANDKYTETPSRRTMYVDDTTEVAELVYAYLKKRGCSPAYISNDPLEHVITFMATDEERDVLMAEFKTRGYNVDTDWL
jgi:hypothetical protein